MQNLKQRMLAQKTWIEQMRKKRDKITEEINILKNLKEQLL